MYSFGAARAMLESGATLADVRRTLAIGEVPTAFIAVARRLPSYVQDAYAEDRIGTLTVNKLRVAWYDEHFGETWQALRPADIPLPTLNARESLIAGAVFGYVIGLRGMHHVDASILHSMCTYLAIDLVANPQRSGDTLRFHGIHYTTLHYAVDTLLSVG